MSNDETGEFADFYLFFSKKNYEKSRRFNQRFRYDPEPLKRFLQKLGNPQLAYRTVHVAGTAGKGSAATFMARALGHSSKTGLYTSPHLESLHERIAIEFSGAPANITTAEFIDIWNSFKKISQVNEISFFDALTALAMVHFQNQHVEWAVFETGLGGRLDSTNNLKPQFCILTPIGLDHQNILGDTIEKITTEKCGILQPGVPVFAFVENPDARQCIEKICREKKSPLQFFKPGPVTNYFEQNFSFIKWIYETHFHTKIPQIDIQIKGRYEIIIKRPLVVFDSAHNEISFREVLKKIARQAGNWRLYINMMKERDIFEIITLVESLKVKNFQIEMYIFPADICGDEPGYYGAPDFIETPGVVVLNREQLVEKLRDENYNHMVAGSMRLYAKLKSVLNLP